MKSANGLTKAERTKDEAEAKRIVKTLRKKTGYHPTFKTVAPGVRLNSASKKYEPICSFFVGSFDTLKQAQAARVAFISKVAKLRAA
jgi:hypothetical protein